MNLRISVANRLFLGFSAVSIGVILLAVVSVLALQNIQKSIELIVEEVAPTEKGLAELQKESLNLSRLVSVYFNEKSFESLGIVKTEFQRSLSDYQ